MYCLFYGSLRGVILTQTVFFIDLKLQQLRPFVLQHVYAKFIMYNLHYFIFKYINYVLYIIGRLLSIDLVVQSSIFYEGDINKLFKLFKVVTIQRHFTTKTVFL